ncbi:TrbC family F-type conjugative pilus assembly protein [Methylomonas methanica]|uniref:Conjugal transfer protein n=1 Tax=Methylomonas methanica TaxID=421 RepID=A0A177MR21_METMH|nr:TrbC family F-type conjugative pilus assembly protein [Methylomonas methanica]OAI08246.1 conjugal transfer protein [Methylomonas methanica]
MRYFEFLSNRPRKVVFFCLANVLLVASVNAEEEWLSRSQRILNTLDGQAKPAWLEGNAYQLEANRQAMEMMQNSKAMQSISASSNPLDKTAIPHPGKPLKVVFVSFSLGDTTLKGMFEEASGQDDALLVFRGPKPGQKLPALFADLKRLLKDIDPVPNIVIDPPRFQKWAVTSVPAIVVESDDKALLQVRGVSSLTWLNDKFKSGATGDLGRLGDVYDIAEIDLLEEIKRRMAAIDWRQKQQQAIARFWDQQKFEVLPVALEDRERVIDMTITAPRNLIAPNGQLIVRAGQPVNPLDKMPFGLCLIVFDATETAQVHWIRQLSCQDKKARVMYLTTSVSRQDGWANLRALETSLNSSVYLLTPDVRSRFQLQHVPSLVEQTGNRLVVRERKLPASAGERS